LFFFYCYAVFALLCYTLAAVFELSVCVAAMLFFAIAYFVWRYIILQYPIWAPILYATILYGVTVFDLFWLVFPLCFLAFCTLFAFSLCFLFGIFCLHCLISYSMRFYVSGLSSLCCAVQSYISGLYAVQLVYVVLHSSSLNFLCSRLCFLALYSKLFCLIPALASFSFCHSVCPAGFLALVF
jgi:hypothetical protein